MFPRATASLVHMVSLISFDASHIGLNVICPRRHSCALVMTPSPLARSVRAAKDNRRPTVDECTGYIMFIRSKHARWLTLTGLQLSAEGMYSNILNPPMSRSAACAWLVCHKYYRSIATIRWLLLCSGLS